MTPHLLSAFGRELSKIADAVVMQNRPDQAPSPAAGAGVAGAGALLGAGVGEAGLYGLADFGGRQNLRQLNKEIGNRATWRQGDLLFGSPEELQHLENIRAQHAPDVRVFHGDAEGFKKFVGEHAAPSNEYHRAKRAIHVHSYAHPASLAHELGHATGSRALHRLPLHKLNNLSPMLSAGLGIAGSALAMEKGTPEAQDKGLRYARNAALLGGATSLPLIAEEARANIRAVNMGRQVGKGMDYAKHLLPSFGQYLTRPVGTAVGTALGVEGLRRYLKARRSSATK